MEIGGPQYLLSLSCHEANGFAASHTFAMMCYLATNPKQQSQLIMD
jgi:hypothetical protein